MEHDNEETIEWRSGRFQVERKTFPGLINFLQTTLNLSFPPSNTHCINPITIQLRALITIQCDHPASAILIRLVFPHWLDVILEQRIIAADFHLTWLLDVSKETPKVLDGGESWHLILIIFPGLVAIRLVVPQGPGMLQWMFDKFSVCCENLIVITRILLICSGKGNWKN